MCWLAEACQHNLNYWRGGNYLALGPAGASHIGGWRWRNRPHLGEWETAIDRGDLPICDAEHLSPEARASEAIMLMLRLKHGVESGLIQKLTNRNILQKFAKRIDELCSLGMIERTQDGFALLDKGIAVADAIAGEFITGH